MIKLPLILISYLGLFFVGLFNFSEVTVDNKLPATIAAGQKKAVELTIRKGEIMGFSKLEIPVPVGFNISPGEIQGASFTFKAQSAKFVWMQLPEEAEFTITYYLEASSSVRGVYDIAGTFSYVKNNRRLDIDLPSKVLLISEKPEETEEAETPEVLADNIISSEPQAEPEVNYTASNEISIPTNLGGVDIPANIKVESEVLEMTCLRTLNKISDTEYEVKLTIINNKITGFGKILETLPEHCKTEKINDAGAVVTQDKNTIKFVWFEIPNSNLIEVSYKMSCLKPIDNPVINGQLSYTDNGIPMVIPVTQELSSETLPLAQENNNEESEIGEVVETITPTQKENQTKSEENLQTITENNTPNYSENNSTISTSETSSSQAIASNESSKTPVTTIPSAETGITYKVQILAAHRVVNKTYFEKNYNFANRFNIENHEGWIKYTTGSFTEYKTARDERERITGQHAKLPGPFVTAYNDGERITVQEALLITNQQWYK